MNSEAQVIDEVIQCLVRRGAALLIGTDPTPVPVTWWRRVDAGRHFYFTTGEDSHAGHVLAAAQARVFYDGAGVEFLDRDDRLLAFLAPVGEQEPDPDAAQSTLAVIQAWKDRFDKDPVLRAFVLDEHHRVTVAP